MLVYFLSFCIFFLPFSSFWCKICEYSEKDDLNQQIAFTGQNTQLEHKKEVQQTLARQGLNSNLEGGPGLVLLMPSSKQGEF